MENFWAPEWQWVEYVYNRAKCYLIIMFFQDHLSISEFYSISESLSRQRRISSPILWQNVLPSCMKNSWWTSEIPRRYMFIISQTFGYLITYTNEIASTEGEPWWVCNFMLWSIVKEISIEARTICKGKERAHSVDYDDSSDGNDVCIFIPFFWVSKW